MIRHIAFATSARVRAGLAAVMLLQILGMTGASAQGHTERADAHEMAKQQGIYRSQGEKIPKGYVHQRGLSHYAELLPAGFEETLKKLGPEQQWLDIGAGSGQAILDYYSTETARTENRSWTPGSGKARAVAVSIEDRRTSQWGQETERLAADRVRYLFGKRLRDYGNDELGKFQLITDVYGGFSYTEELSMFMEKVLGLLALEGSFYSLLQSVKLEDGRDDPKTYYLTSLFDAAGRDVKVCSWLKRITCVEVSCESKSDWDAPTELIHVRKVCNGVSVPALSRLKYEAGTPPGREFRLKP